MGGVDANLNFANEDHNGLAATSDMLNALWEAHRDSFDGLTQADFYAWSYIAGFYFTCDQDTVPWVPLRVGRNTYTNFDEDEDLPPGAEFGSGNHQAVLDYFQDNFSLNQQETAIALGAHTLGGASIQNSGYIRDWTRSENTFNNDYYEALVDPPGQGGWEQVQLQNGKFQWQWGCNNRCRDLMLNVDMNLFYDLDDYFVGDSGQVVLPATRADTAPPNLDCTGNRIFADCFPQRAGTDTHFIVDRYENGNNEEFVNAFAVVFGDIVSRVKDGATLVEPFSAPAGWPLIATNGNNNGGGGNNNGGG